MQKEKFDSKIIMGAVVVVAIVLIGIFVLLPTEQQNTSNGSFQPSNTPPKEGISVGDIAPNFSLETIEGDTIRLSDLKGKSVMVNFWASWCPFCVDEMPLFQTIADENPEKLVILGVNLQEGTQPIKDFVKRTGVKYPILLDPTSEVKKTYNVFTQPVTYFIDETGIITEKKFGPILEEELREKLEVTFNNSVVPNLIAFESVPAVKTDIPVQETNGQKHTVSLEEIFTGCPGKDCIPSIDSPNFESVADADTWMQEDFLVLGVTQFETKVAYPIPILDWHEIVNDEIDGVPVLISYCPLCATGIAFHRNIDGQAVEFGVSGKLRNSDLIMYDRQTDTYWQQVTGEGIVGELSGFKLKKIPVEIAQWKNWKKQFPDSKILSRDTGQFRTYGQYPYGDYKTNSRISFPTNNSDSRLHEKAIVFGFENNGVAKAYSFDSMNSKKIVNDSFGGIELVVVFDDALQTVKAFERDVHGQKVDFELKDSMLFDSITNSFWGLDGKFVSGEIAEVDLQRLNLEYSFWFAWTAFYPDTKLV